MSKTQLGAFTVNGFSVTPDQQAAGLAVMVGTFSRKQVTDALRIAGVQNLPGQCFTVNVAVDRLLQDARKRGEIRVVAGKERGLWERLP